MTVRCPDCGELIEAPAGTRSGDLFECPNCAGHALRVRAKDGDWSATLAYRVSCPNCERTVTLSEEAKAGDEIKCCGRRYRLTFEYGAYAAEALVDRRRARGAPVRAAVEENGMKLGSLSAGVAAVAGAVLSSLCCLLPLTVIALGLGSGAFMAVTMQYRWILIPTGVFGVIGGVALYVRERRRCDALACRMAGRRITLALLIAAGVVVVTAIALDQFPEVTADVLAHLTDAGGVAPAGHDMKGMNGR